MSMTELLFLAAVASLLFVALYGVRRRPRATPSPLPHATMVSTTVTAPKVRPPAPDFVPPPGSLKFSDLQVGQTISIKTETASYVLTLRDIETRQFEAVRDGMQPDKTRAKERFTIVFHGSHLPPDYHYGWLLLGGRLAFHKIKGGKIYNISTSTRILKIFTSIPLRQAS